MLSGIPYLPINASALPVVACTDPNEQEGVLLRPDLEAAVPR